MRLVRVARRGRFHTRSCWRTRGRRGARGGEEEASSCGQREFCADCCPLCVVCLCVPGAPMTPCPEGHGVCDACMRAHARHEGSAGRLPRCPCGQGEEIDVRSLHFFDAWCEGVRTSLSDALQRGTAPGPTGVAERICDDALCARCPWCGTAFDGFDGCAALVCATCARDFCGLCLCRCDDPRSAHAHVIACPLNPTRPPTFYVPADVLQEVSARRGERRVADALEGIRRTDGAVVAALIARGVRRLRPDVRLRGGATGARAARAARVILTLLASGGVGWVSSGLILSLLLNGMA